MRIDADGTVTIHGTITANGVDSAANVAGGGSGGAIYISCVTFGGATNGLLRVNGGSVDSVGVQHSGGGGGGRIAVVYTDVASPAGARFSTSPGDGWAERANTYGWDDTWHYGAECGTVHVSDTALLSPTLVDHLFTDVNLFIAGVTSWAVNSLTVSNCSVTFAEPGFRLAVTNELRLDSGGNLGVGGLDCGSSVVLTNGGSLCVYSDATNGVAPDWGALVSVTNDVVIGPSSWIYPFSDDTNGGSVLFRMRDLVIATNAGFNANARGYAAGYGPGRGYGPSYGAGGGHGGKGGDGKNTGVLGGGTNGSVSAPIGPGSGGDAHSSRTGAGREGGSVRIEARGTATVSGTVTADGGLGLSTLSGGGAGGSIFITCGTFQGSADGLLSADGGDNEPPGSPSNGSGGGGGGRIALVYANTVGAPLVRFSTSPGPGWAGLDPDNHWQHGAEAGTVYLVDTNLLSGELVDGQFTDVNLFVSGVTSWAVNSLTVSNCSVTFAESGFQLDVTGDIRVDEGGCLGIGALGMASDFALTCGGDLVLTNGGSLVVYSGKTNGAPSDDGGLVNVVGDVVIGPTSWILPYSHPTDGGSALFRARHLVIATNGGFNANGKGYAENQGQGRGNRPFYCGGGGYGGKGGSGNLNTSPTATGGAPYGHTNAPLDPGSGGGQWTGWNFGGGRGGGLVRIEADGTVHLNGTIMADGQDAWIGMYAGGGAGGGIFVMSSGFRGGATSRLKADGGDSATISSVYQNGGGGGGRIAVWYGVEGMGEDIRSRLEADEEVPVAIITSDYSGLVQDVSVMNGVGWQNPPSGNGAYPGTVVFLTLVRGSLIMMR